MFAYDHNHVAVLVCGRFGRHLLSRSSYKTRRRLNHSLSALPVNPSAMSLLRQYVEEPCIGRHDDPVAWWRGRMQIYRELARRLARRHLDLRRCIVCDE